MFLLCIFSGKYYVDTNVCDNVSEKWGKDLINIGKEMLLELNDEMLLEINVQKQILP